MKRHTSGAVFCALTLSLAGCRTPSPSLPDDPCPTPQTPIFSVEKIPSLKSNLIFGIDTSSLISLEQSGVTFYDFDGNQADALQTLAQAGVNCIRLRVWNDPFDGNGNGYGGGWANACTSRTKQTALCITAVAPWTIRLCLMPRATPWTA